MAYWDKATSQWVVLEGPVVDPVTPYHQRTGEPFYLPFRSSPILNRYLHCQRSDGISGRGWWRRKREYQHRCTNTGDLPDLRSHRHEK